MGTKIYTISDIAEYAGVSRSTVSRVLNNVNTKVKVSEETQKKIAEAVQHFDYSPNANARRLSLNKSNIIGLQLPARHLSGAIFDYNLLKVLGGIEVALEKSNYKIMLLFCDEEYMRQEEYIRLLRNKTIDGLLIWGTQLKSTYSNALNNYPALFINTVPRGYHYHSFLRHDEFNGAKSLTLSLLKKGVKKILYLSLPRTNSIVVDRLAGFQDALRSSNIRCADDDIIHIPEASWPGCDRMLADLFAGEFNYDAVFCSNDRLAGFVHDAAVAAGLTPQRDFLLAGGDHADDCLNYKLHTFEIDQRTIGYEAVRTMISMIKDTSDLCVQRTLMPKLIEI